MADTNNSWVESYLEALVSWPSPLASVDPTIDVPPQRPASGAPDAHSYKAGSLRFMQLACFCADGLLTVFRLHVRTHSSGSGVCISTYPRQDYASGSMATFRAVPLGVPSCTKGVDLWSCLAGPILSVDPPRCSDVLVSL